MLSILAVLLLTQVPCAPSEMSVVCQCKQGMVSACVTLAGDDAKKAAEVLAALEQFMQVAGEETQERLEAAVEALSQAQDCSEPPNCKGQDHHPISRRIARALERHLTLKGLYKPRDPRFVARAKDEQAHCGYQGWHRKVDEEVTQWIRNHERATPKEFEDKLREIYSRSEMRERFPNGF